VSDSGEAKGNSIKALVLYWSATGNTEKVAKAIERGAKKAGVTVDVVKIAEAADLDLYDYDLVFMGTPSYSYMVPELVLKYIKGKAAFHKQRRDIKIGAPRLPGKGAVVFVTYSGPHTGIDEAIPVGKYVGQFFAHIGYEVLDEWYVIGEFHGNEVHSTQGPLGDIRGRPNADDLARIEQQIVEVISKSQK
jgi:multimeric flavodoxin WrbA